MIDFYVMMVENGWMTVEEIDPYWRRDVEDEIRRKNENGL